MYVLVQVIAPTMSRWCKLSGVLPELDNSKEGKRVFDAEVTSSNALKKILNMRGRRKLILIDPDKMTHLVTQEIVTELSNSKNLTVVWVSVSPLPEEIRGEKKPSYIQYRRIK